MFFNKIHKETRHVESVNVNTVTFTLLGHRVDFGQIRYIPTEKNYTIEYSKLYAHINDGVYWMVIDQHIFSSQKYGRIEVKFRFREKVLPDMSKMMRYEVVEHVPEIMDMKCWDKPLNWPSRPSIRDRQRETKEIDCSPVGDAPLTEIGRDELKEMLRQDMQGR